MKTRFKYTLLLIFSVTLVSSCKKENRCDCIKRTGKIITEHRNISGFDRLKVEDNLNVYLTQDSAFSLKVEAGENIVPLIKTELTNGTLTIKNDNRCNWTRSYDKPMNVYVSMPIIKYILSDATGKITGLNPITSDSFNIQMKNSGDIELILNNNKIVSHVRGSGDLILRGKSIDHSADIGGTGYLQCSDLNTNYSYVHTYTTGLCYVRCTGTLDCRIDAKGDLYCYGNPPIILKTIKGAGNLYIQ